MEDSDFLDINVSAYTRLSDRRHFFYGEISDREGRGIGPGLIEYSDKAVEPGFFTHLEDVANSIEAVFKERLSDGDTYPGDMRVIFRNVIDEEYGDSIIHPASSYLGRKLNEDEFENLISLTDDRIRPLISRS